MMNATAIIMITMMTMMAIITEISDDLAFGVTTPEEVAAPFPIELDGTIQ
jgi:hypothetical protein